MKLTRAQINTLAKVERGEVTAKRGLRRRIIIQGAEKKIIVSLTRRDLIERECCGTMDADYVYTITDTGKAVLTLWNMSQEEYARTASKSAHA